MPRLQLLTYIALLDLHIKLIDDAIKRIKRGNTFHVEGA